MSNAISAGRDVYLAVATKMEGQSAAGFSSELLRTAEEIRSGRADVRSDITNVLSRSEADPEAVADAVEQAGRDVGEAAGHAHIGIKKLEGTTAGRAVPKREGSAVMDATKATVCQGERVVNKTFMVGVKAHEVEHIKQAELDADRVDLRGGKKLTGTLFRELGAMLQQKKESPESIQDLSPEYKQNLEAHGNLLPAERTIELARKGFLQQYAAEVNALAA